MSSISDSCEAVVPSAVITVGPEGTRGDTRGHEWTEPIDLNFIQNLLMSTPKNCIEDLQMLKY